MRSIRFVATRRELAAVALLLACFGLALTFAYPSVPVERSTFDDVVALDITQSMNVIDYRMNGEAVSRLTFAKKALRQALLELPCGSKLGWAVFTEYRTMLLLEPVEVCANRDDLFAVLDRIDNRIAWAGASEIAKGLHWGIRTARGLPSRPALVFITDGHEAPPLDSPGPTFEDKPGEIKGIIVGVGGPNPAPIPKTDREGHALGFWTRDDVITINRRVRNSSIPGERMVEQPGAVTAEAISSRTEHLSSLKEPYLRQLATATRFGYRRLENAGDMGSALRQPEFARTTVIRIDIRWIPAALALLSLVVLYVLDLSWPRRILKRLRGYRYISVPQ